MNILDRLFGSPVRVKILRFFLMNPELTVTQIELCKAAKVSKNSAKKELALLEKIAFIKNAKKGKERGFQLNNLFQYNRALKHLVIDSTPVSRELLIRRFKELGRGLKFVALSGIFVGGDIEGSVDENAGLDILMVGDNVKNARVKKVLSKVEAEIGKELHYVLFDTHEFRYRRSMYDKFVLSVLDNEHDVLIDSLNA